jgi:hypothetical protein
MIYHQDRGEGENAFTHIPGGGIVVWDSEHFTWGSYRGLLPTKPSQLWSQLYGGPHVVEGQDPRCGLLASY